MLEGPLPLPRPQHLVGAKDGAHTLVGRPRRALTIAAAIAKIATGVAIPKIHALAVPLRPAGGALGAGARHVLVKEAAVEGSVDEVPRPPFTHSGTHADKKPPVRCPPPGRSHGRGHHDKGASGRGRNGVRPGFGEGGGEEG